MKIKFFIYSLFVCCFGYISCNSESQSSETQKTELKESLKVPNFDKNLAFSYIEKQLDFGYRIPSTPSHTKCANWILETLKTYTDTAYIQEFEATTYDSKNHLGKNIIAKINPSQTNRILVTAHWDTRHIADQEISDKTSPILGANDGASGVAVILAILNAIKSQKIDLGIDIVFFDIEDYGQPENSGFKEMKDSYCLGSQYWAKTLDKNHNISFGILLDMVGGKNAKFPKEGYSIQLAPNLLNQFWNLGTELGFGSFFVQSQGPAILDDHVYASGYTNIPFIDIIQLNSAQGSTFGDYWHTHNDNINSVDKNTLNAVGQTLIHFLYQNQHKSN